MIIEKRKFSAEKGKQIFNINGIDFDINTDEFRDFLTHCASFMDISKDGFETMIASISDSIIDNENQHVTLEEIRPQLKFLREMSFYLKSIYHNEH